MNDPLGFQMVRGSTEAQQGVAQDMINLMLETETLRRYCNLTATIPTAEGMVLHGLIASINGREVVRGERALSDGDPELTGVRLANELRSRGASDLLDALRGMEKVPSPQPE